MGATCPPFAGRGPNPVAWRTPLVACVRSKLPFPSIYLRKNHLFLPHHPPIISPPPLKNVDLGLAGAVSRQVHVGSGARSLVPWGRPPARASVSPPAAGPVGAWRHPWVLPRPPFAVWGGQGHFPPRLAGFWGAWLVSCRGVSVFGGLGEQLTPPAPRNGMFWGGLRPPRLVRHPMGCPRVPFGGSHQ